MAVILGLDVGIASIGFALVDNKQNKIITTGIHLFDAAEQPKTGASLAEPRRLARGQRRRIRRRGRRLFQIRQLLAESGFTGIKELHGKLGSTTPELDPWQLRADALERMLTDEELARVLLHIAKRRGFKSNRKSQNKKDDDGKRMLEGARKIQDEMEQGRFDTVGAYLASLAKKRNAPDFYERTILRALLEKEVDFIFSCQQDLGNPLATDELKDKYKEKAFFQRPLQSTLHLVGPCQFEDNEKRAPKASSSAELFIVLSRLNSLRIKQRGGEEKPLTTKECQLILEEAYKLKTGATYGKARKLLALDDNETFNISYRKTNDKDKTWEMVRDRAEKNAKLAVFPAYHEIKKIVSGVDKEAWESLDDDREVLDQIAYALTFFEEEQEVLDQLATTGLDQEIKEQLLELPFSGSVNLFRGTVNLSLKALNKVLPHLDQKYNYSESCELAGYHHSKQDAGELDLLPSAETTRNPVVDRAIAQSRKVINAVIRRYGTPDIFHIETARDLGRSAKDRRDIERENKKFQEKKAVWRDHAREILGREPSGHEFLKYRLWHEQGGYCVYSGKQIGPEDLRDPLATQVDHILPLRRSWDDGLSNKVICFTDENQNKGDKTPFEYMGSGQHWGELVQRANQLPFQKRRRLLVETFDEEVAGEWKERAINDTRYISRFLKNYIQASLKCHPDGSLQVFAVSGGITGMLRGIWGLAKDRQESVRHHALDAIVVACTTPGTVQGITNWNRYQRGKTGDKGYHSPKPWPGFRKDVLGEVDGVIVSRQPVRKATGKAHQDTIMSLRKDSEGKDYLVKRLKLKDFKPSHLKKLVDVQVDDGEVSGRNAWLYHLLKERLESHGNDAKKAFEQPVMMPLKKGKDQSLASIIRSVKIRDDGQSYIPICGREGVAGNAQMVRTDIFVSNGKYYLTPVYVHHFASGELPNRVCMAGKPEKEWPEITEEFSFLFSLRKNDYVILEKASGEVVQGYYVTMDRSCAGITLRPHDAPDNKSDYRNLGVKTLKNLHKCAINYFGEMSIVKQEKRSGLAKRNAAKPRKGISSQLPDEV